MIAQAPDIPLTSCPFLYQNLIGTVAGGMGACLGLGEAGMETDGGLAEWLKH